MSEEQVQTQEQAAPKKLALTEDQLRSRKEIYISIDWKGLKDFYTKVCHDLPFKGYKAAFRKLEGVSKKLMTGSASLLGMPAGIIVRNTARAAHNSADGRYAHMPQLVGVAASLAGWYYAGVAAAGYLTAAMPATAAAITGTLGSWGMLGVVAATTWPVLLPAFTVATLATASVIGTAVAAVSTLPALLNGVVAFRRSQDSLKGIKYTEDDLTSMAEEFDRDSPSAKYERSMVSTAKHALDSMSPASRATIFKSLKSEFDAAANGNEPAEATADNTVAPRRRSNGIKQI